MLSCCNAFKSKAMVCCEVKLPGKLWYGVSTPSLLTFDFILTMKTSYVVAMKCQLQGSSDIEIRGMAEVAILCH